MLFLTDLKQQGPLPGPVMTAAAALPTDKTIDFNSGTFENEPDVQSECGTTSQFAGRMKSH